MTDLPSIMAAAVLTFTPTYAVQQRTIEPRIPAGPMVAISFDRYGCEIRTADPRARIVRVYNKTSEADAVDRFVGRDFRYPLNYKLYSIRNP